MWSISCTPPFEAWEKALFPSSAPPAIPLKGIDLFFLFLWKGLLMRQGHFPLASDGVEVGWGAEAEQAGGQVSPQ